GAKLDYGCGHVCRPKDPLQRGGYRSHFSGPYPKTVCNLFMDDYGRTAQGVVTMIEELENKGLYRPILMGLVMTACVLSAPVHSYKTGGDKIHSEIFRLPIVSESPFVEATTSKPVERPISVKSSLDQIRILTGFTQDQIAELFEVDRRSIYHWLNGQEPSAQKHEKISRILSALQYMDRGLSRINKQLLMSPVENGKILKDYLTEGDFSAFMKFAGRGDHPKLIEINSPVQSPREKGKLKPFDMLSD
ncbi:MAG: helix-turn-helix transcriptional regulator, partial [Bdellovibrionales bacterium]